MKTGRDKIAPVGLLLPRREGLADLADRLMTLMYGSHAETSLKYQLMHQPTGVDLRTSIVGDDEEVIALVKSQIVGALGAGQIVLALELDTAAFSTRTDHYVDLGEFTTVDADNKFDFETEWVLAPRFWAEPAADAAISWHDSRVKVLSEFVYNGCSALEVNPPFKHWHPLSRHFGDVPSTLNLKAFVANPDVALRRFFKFDPLPSEAQVAEYRSSIANLIKEATAAAWRFLAVTGAGCDFNQRELMRAMLVYLKSQGLYDEKDDRPSQGTLLAVAGKVRKQFQQAEAVIEQPVYVSSTPVGDPAPSPPRRQTPAGSGRRTKK